MRWEWCYLGVRMRSLSIVFLHGATRLLATILIVSRHWPTVTVPLTSSWPGTGVMIPETVASWQWCKNICTKLCWPRLVLVSNTHSSHGFRVRCHSLPVSAEVAVTSTLEILLVSNTFLSLKDSYRFIAKWVVSTVRRAVLLLMLLVMMILLLSLFIFLLCLLLLISSETLQSAKIVQKSVIESKKGLCLEVCFEVKNNLRKVSHDVGHVARTDQFSIIICW